MKKILNIILFCFVSIVISYGQNVPSGFNYQGIARDADDKPYQDQIISLEISIIDANTGATPYRETHTVNTTSRGVFNVIIGQGNILNGDFASIDWGVTEYNIKTRIDPNGGEEYVNAGSSKLLSVPYAMYALDVANGSSGEPGPKGDKGDQGDPGPQGPKGEKGDKGDQGDPGNDGTGVSIVGSVPNAASLPNPYSGEIGDMFISQDNGHGHVWNGNSFDDVGEIKGPKGEQGVQGEGGMDGADGKNGLNGFSRIWRWDSNSATTDSEFTANSTQFSSISQFQLNREDIEQISLSDWLNSISIGDQLQISSLENPENFGLYEVLNISNNSSVFTYFVNSIIDHGSISSGEFQIGFLKKGDKGEQGEKGDKGEQGEKGEKGDQGDPGPGGSGLWTQNGDNINYTQGNVSIGTTEAGYDLNINENMIAGRVIIEEYLGLPRIATDDGTSMNINGHKFNFGGNVEFSDGISVGNTGVSFEGLIKYDQGDFQGRTSSGWKSLSSQGLWTEVDNAANYDGNVVVNGSNVSMGFQMFNSYGRVGTYTSHDLDFMTSGLTRATISPTGNFGIGNTSPNAKLDVDGDVQAQGQIRVGGTNPMLLLQGSGAHTVTTVGSSLTLSTPTSNKIYFQHGTTNSFTAESSGVGINTANPNSDLHIVENSGGNYQIRLENGANEWLIGASGGQQFRVLKSGSTSYAFLTGGTANWSSSSDRRLKDNIKDVNSVLDKYMDLRLKNFNYIGSNKETIGLIAQDVQNVFPELVEEIDETNSDFPNARNDKYLGLNYSAFIYLSIKAIQEQQEIIDAQDERLSSLEKELAEIKTLIKKTK